MNSIIVITERYEYDFCVKQGFEPLLDERFDIDIRLRVKLQREKFGRGEFGKDISKANEKFYRWMWEHKPHYCEETMRPLSKYSAIYISHILTRGAHPDMATDPRNVNILCGAMHNKWEFGDRKTMRIYRKNQRIIEKLKQEYSQL